MASVDFCFRHDMCCVSLVVQIWIILCYPVLGLESYSTRNLLVSE
jgi:hypothetical protein